MEKIMKKYVLTLAAFSHLMSANAEAEICSDGKSIAEKRGVVKETLKMYQDSLDQFMTEAKIQSLPEAMVDARQRMTNGVANIEDRNAGNCNNAGQDEKKVTRCCEAIDKAQALIDEVSKSFVTWKRETHPQIGKQKPVTMTRRDRGKAMYNLKPVDTYIKKGEKQMRPTPIKDKGGEDK